MQSVPKLCDKAFRVQIEHPAVSWFLVTANSTLPFQWGQGCLRHVSSEILNPQPVSVHYTLVQTPNPIYQPHRNFDASSIFCDVNVGGTIEPIILWTCCPQWFSSRVVHVCGHKVQVTVTIPALFSTCATTYRQQSHSAVRLHPAIMTSMAVPLVAEQIAFVCKSKIY